LGFIGIIADFQEFVLLQIMAFWSKNDLLLTEGSLKLKNDMICNGNKNPESLRFLKNQSQTKEMYSGGSLEVRNVIISIGINNS
jgi:hypothetical protein